MVTTAAKMWLTTCLVVLSLTHLNFCVCGDTVEQQLKVLSKQVTALLDMRKDDIQIIEENLRKKLLRSQELVEIRDGIKFLR